MLKYDELDHVWLESATQFAPDHGALIKVDPEDEYPDLKQTLVHAESRFLPYPTKLSTVPVYAPLFQLKLEKFEIEDEMKPYVVDPDDTCATHASPLRQLCAP